MQGRIWVKSNWYFPNKFRSDFRRSLFAAEIFQFGSTVVQDCDESIPGTSKQEDSTVAGADIV